MPEFIGRVIKTHVGTGSKSERDAVCLATDSGEYVLRRQDGNPFADPELEALTGQRIRGDGFLRANTLILQHWDVLEEK